MSIEAKLAAWLGAALVVLSIGAESGRFQGGAVLVERKVPEQYRTTLFLTLVITLLCVIERASSSVYAVKAIRCRKVTAFDDP